MIRTISLSVPVHFSNDSILYFSTLFLNDLPCFYELFFSFTGGADESSWGVSYLAPFLSLNQWRRPLQQHHVAESQTYRRISPLTWPKKNYHCKTYGLNFFFYEFQSVMWSCCWTNVFFNQSYAVRRGLEFSLLMFVLLILSLSFCQQNKWILDFFFIFSISTWPVFGSQEKGKIEFKLFFLY